MDAKEIIKTLVSERKISQSVLAEMAGFKSQSNITGILNRGSSLRVDNFIQMLSALNCNLIVRDKETEVEYEVTDKQCKITTAETVSQKSKETRPASQTFTEPVSEISHNKKIKLT